MLHLKCDASRYYYGSKKESSKEDSKEAPLTRHRPLAFCQSKRFPLERKTFRLARKVFLFLRMV